MQHKKLGTAQIFVRLVVKMCNQRVRKVCICLPDEAQRISDVHIIMHTYGMYIHMYVRTYHYIISHFANGTFVVLYFVPQN